MSKPAAPLVPIRLNLKTRFIVHQALKFVAQKYQGRSFYGPHWCSGPHPRTGNPDFPKESSREMETFGPLADRLWSPCSGKTRVFRLSWKEIAAVAFAVRVSRHLIKEHLLSEKPNFDPKAKQALLRRLENARRRARDRYIRQVGSKQYQQEAKAWERNLRWINSYIVWPWRGRLGPLIFSRNKALAAERSIDLVAAELQRRGMKVPERRELRPLVKSARQSLRRLLEDFHVRTQRRSFNGLTALLLDPDPQMAAALGTWLTEAVLKRAPSLALPEPPAQETETKNTSTDSVRLLMQSWKEMPKEERSKRFQELVQEGWSRRAIAKLVGCSEGTVRHALRRRHRQTAKNPQVPRSAVSVQSTALGRVPEPAPASHSTASKPPVNSGPLQVQPAPVTDKTSAIAESKLEPGEALAQRPASDPGVATLSNAEIATSLSDWLKQTLPLPDDPRYVVSDVEAGMTPQDRDGESVDFETAKQQSRPRWQPQSHEDRRRWHVEWIMGCLPRVRPLASDQAEIIKLMCEPHLKRGLRTMHCVPRRSATPPRRSPVWAPPGSRRTDLERSLRSREASQSYVPFRRY